MFERTYEPIGPGEQPSVLRRAAKFLQPLLIILGVFLALAWWKGEAPGWLAVLNIAGVLSGFIFEALRKSKLKEVERLFLELLSGDSVPPALTFYEILGDQRENPYEDPVNRYALGLLGPQEFKAEMTSILRPL